jgi:RNA recognition motif-containing protein
MGAFFFCDPGKSFTGYLYDCKATNSRKYQRMKMETKLYVGNLSYDTTEEGLRTMFAKAGTVVSVDMIKDRYTGRMKGFAFVTMNSAEEAQEAIKILNEKMLDDRAIRVNVAKPREESSRGSYGNQR